MTKIVHNSMQTLLFVSTIALCLLAQQRTQEKHVRDVRHEQTQDLISASDLCQQVRAGHSYVHTRPVDPARLETNLSALMQKSDEVVLASPFVDQTSALSPSNEEVNQYFDVKVLR